MLFNSYSFLFLFLPISLALFYALIRLGLRRYIFIYLAACSMVFYGISTPKSALLITLSIVLNYYAGVLIERHAKTPLSGRILVGAILADVAMLAYFKYANFFVDNANLLLGTDYNLSKLFLPLAISFYTFQQIAYLMDVRRGEVQSQGLMKYATFVLFFPQLIAGPIVHYNEMMPDFFGRKLARFASANILIGLTIFALGLFKKTVIAATAGLYASPVFEQAQTVGRVDIAQAWMAGITYTIQLYFDFSGYSDMAVGLARMFGIRLPPNFHSPLRAASIADYWRRWHITLQHFIVSYMFQPLVLPLARFAAERRLGKTASFYVTVVAPTFTAFVVVGLWHGAGWTFILFGALHGFYLSVNEYWQQRQRKVRRQKGPPGRLNILGYRLLTLFAVIFANVLFRSPSVGDAVTIWRGMFDLASIDQLAAVFPTDLAQAVQKPLLFALVFFAVIEFMPNTQQFMARYEPVRDWQRWRKIAPPVISLTWRPTLGWIAATTAILFLAVSWIARGQADFIYFNF